MATTNFVTDVTVIEADWLNDVDESTYSIANVKHDPYLAKGDGVTDDTVAIQAALDGGAAQIYFPAGKYIISAGLTVPDFVKICGENAAFGSSGGDSRDTELSFSITSGVGLTLGIWPTIENISITNSTGSHGYPTTTTFSGNTATAVSTSGSGNVTLNSVRFVHWLRCIDLYLIAYYSRINNCEFLRNEVAITASTPVYNLQISECKSSATNYFYSGGTNFGRNIKVIGGSIEGYIVAFSQFNILSAHGTYFESAYGGGSAVIFDPGVSASSTSVFGCLIYMNNHDRVFNGSSLTNCGFTSNGNSIVASSGASGTIYAVLPTTGNVDMSGDTVDSAFTSDALYVDSIANATKYSVQMPILPAGHDHILYSGLNFAKNNYSIERVNSGATQINNGATATYTYPSGRDYVYLITTAANLAITFPTVATLPSGTIRTIVFDSITNATWGPDTFNGAPAVTVADTPYSFIYLNASGRWHRYK